MPNKKKKSCVKANTNIPQKTNAFLENSQCCDSASGPKQINSGKRKKRLEDIIKIVQNRAPTIQKNDNDSSSTSKPSVEVVVYENPAKRKKQSKNESRQTEDGVGGKGTNAVRNDGHAGGYFFNMEQARQDIRKFAINSFRGQDRDDAMQKFLIEKGAKPPKNKYYNYKEFTQKRIKEKQEEAKRIELTRELGEGVKKRKFERKKTQDDVGLHAAQVGKFKRGILHLNRYDIKKIMTTKICR